MLNPLVTRGASGIVIDNERNPTAAASSTALRIDGRAKAARQQTPSEVETLSEERLLHLAAI